MKLENQVCSREPAEELEKLGVKQNSLWYWFEVYEMKEEIGWSLTISDEDREKYKIHKKFKIAIRAEDVMCLSNQGVKKIASAFTDAELDEMLPPSVEICEKPYTLLSGKMKGGTYFTGLYHKNLTYHETQGTNGANSKTEMVIFLIKNNLIKIKNE